MDCSSSHEAKGASHLTAKVIFHITSTVRGVSYSRLRKDIARLDRCLSYFGETNWYVVESNSPSPETLIALKRLAGRVSRFKFKSLGRDSGGFRTERIAKARNACLDLVSASVEGSELQNHILVVVDLDGINSKVRLTPTVIRTVLRDRVAVFPIQIGPYYDISALRHPVWNPTDPWKEFELLRATFGEANALNLAVKSKQIDLRGMVAPISVTSAFGGLGLYPLSEVLLTKAKYVGRGSDGSELCEHVGFNLSLWESGVVLQIDPTFVNAGYTEHTRYSHPILGPILRLRHLVASSLPAPMRRFLVKFLLDR